MKKLIVIKINGYDYLLEDMDGCSYSINMDFYDVKVQIGDTIYLPNEILKEKNLYTFGPVQIDSSVDEMIKIIHNDQNIYLQRYYG